MLSDHDGTKVIMLRETTEHTWTLGIQTAYDWMITGSLKKLRRK